MEEVVPGIAGRVDRVIALLARDEPPALAGLRAEEDIRYRWPLTGAERRAVRFVREEAGA